MLHRMELYAQFHAISMPESFKMDKTPEKQEEASFKAETKYPLAGCAIHEKW